MHASLLAQGIREAWEHKLNWNKRFLFRVLWGRPDVFHSRRGHCQWYWFSWTLHLWGSSWIQLLDPHLPYRCGEVGLAVWRLQAPEPQVSWHRALRTAPVHRGRRLAQVLQRVLTVSDEGCCSNVFDDAGAREMQTAFSLSGTYGLCVSVRFVYSITSTPHGNVTSSTPWQYQCEYNYVWFVMTALYWLLQTVTSLSIISVFLIIRQDRYVTMGNVFSGAVWGVNKC